MKLNHKLVKQLRDSGFPFVSVEEIRKTLVDGRDIGYEVRAFRFEEGGIIYKLPTREDLINACGGKEVLSFYHHLLGNRTLAKLYLELNKK